MLRKPWIPFHKASHIFPEATNHIAKKARADAKIGRDGVVSSGTGVIRRHRSEAARRQTLLKVRSRSQQEDSDSTRRAKWCLI